MCRRMTLGAHNLPAGGLHHTDKQTPTEGNPEQVAPEKNEFSDIVRRGSFSE